jgi:hypothetical protein
MLLTSYFKILLIYIYIGIYFYIIQPGPELPPHRKQACADSKRDSKMTKINFPAADIIEL